MGFLIPFFDYPCFLRETLFVYFFAQGKYRLLWPPWCLGVEKLKAKGVHEKLLSVISSWLAERDVKVCVDGVFSTGFALRNMVFQGTVLGPTLWSA